MLTVRWSAISSPGWTCAQARCAAVLAAMQALTSLPPPGIPSAQRQKSLRCLPGTDGFLYKAKAWYKPALTPEEEERTRTVRAFDLAAEH